MLRAVFYKIERVRVCADQAVELRGPKVQVVFCRPVTVVVDVDAEALECFDVAATERQRVGERLGTCIEVVAKCAHNGPAHKRAIEMCVHQNTGANVGRGIDQGFETRLDRNVAGKVVVDVKDAGSDLECVNDRVTIFVEGNIEHRDFVASFDAGLAHECDVALHARYESAFGRLCVAELRECADAVRVSVEDVNLRHVVSLSPNDAGCAARKCSCHADNGTLPEVRVRINYVALAFGGAWSGRYVPVTLRRTRKSVFICPRFTAKQPRSKAWSSPLWREP